MHNKQEGEKKQDIKKKKNKKKNKEGFEVTMSVEIITFKKLGFFPELAAAGCPVSNPDNLWKSPLLVLWRHWMHLNAMHPVMSENQFHCTSCVCVCHNERKCQTNGKHDKRYRRYFQVSSSMHNAKKITTRARGPVHQSICHPYRRKKEKFVCV